MATRRRLAQATEETRLASLAIFYDIWGDEQYGRRLTRKSALTMLCMYDSDDTAGAEARPGDYPNIALLRRVLEVRRAAGLSGPGGGRGPAHAGGLRAPLYVREPRGRPSPQNSLAAPRPPRCNGTQEGLDVEFLVEEFGPGA
jgi:hypothetical protein